MNFTINGLEVEVHRYQPATEDRNSGGALGGMGDWNQGDAEEIEFDVYDEDGVIWGNEESVNDYMYAAVIKKAREWEEVV